MLKCNVNKGHLLLGFLFLLQRWPKAVRADTSPACTANECSYDSLPPILGKGEAKFAPQKSCYVDTERVNVTCKGDLRGPPYNLCTSGNWLYPFGPTYEDITMCNKTDVPKHGNIHPDEAFFDLYERIYYSCNDNYSLVGPSEAVCESGGVWNPPTVPTCKADCLSLVLDNGSVSPDTPTVRNGEVITFECSKNFTKVGLSVTTCRDGHFDPPELPVCYAQCNRPVIPNSDSTSPYPALHHGESVSVTCNTGYSNGQSESMTSMCIDGSLDAMLPLCYAQCHQVIIPNSDATSVGPSLHHGDVITVTCDNGFSNGYSDSTTSVCSNGTFIPPLPHCYAQCSRPVIPNSDATSSDPVLNHGDVIVVRCNSGYSNGNSQSSSSVCSYGSLNPTVPLCYAQCRRKVIPNSDSSSSALIHHGEVLIVTCDEGYSSGQENSTSSACSHGIFSPPLPTCYPDCKSLKDPDYGKVVIGSDPYYHREVAVFECNGNYTLVGSQEIYCYDGLWDKDPPVCMAFCSRPVIPNSDATSPNPLVPHGIAITVTCEKGYTNSDAARTTLVCVDGTLFPDEPKCIGETMTSYHVASIVLGVLGTVLGLAAISFEIYKTRKDKNKLAAIRLELNTTIIAIEKLESQVQYPLTTSNA